MASEFPKKLNAFQSTRAPQFVSDRSIADSIDDMLQTGELPTGEKTDRVGLIKYSQQHFENEAYAEDLRFDVATQQYKFARRYKAGRSSIDVTGTLEDIADAIEIEAASLQREANEAANPVQPTEKQAAVNEWMASYKFGVEAKAYLDILPEKHALNFVRIIWTSFETLYGKAVVTADLINGAYVAAWDLGKLDGYMHEAERLAHETEQARLAESLSVVNPSSPTPSANLPQESDERRQQDKENRTKPIAELRHEAIFGTRGGRVPSTGTVRR